MVIDVMIVWIMLVSQLRLQLLASQLRLQLLASQLRLQLLASQLLASIAQGLVNCQRLWATRRLAHLTSLHIRHWPSDQ